MSHIQSAWSILTRSTVKCLTADVTLHEHLTLCVPQKPQISTTKALMCGVCHGNPSPSLNWPMYILPGVHSRKEVLSLNQLGELYFLFLLYFARFTNYTYGRHWIAYNTFISVQHLVSWQEVSLNSLQSQRIWPYPLQLISSFLSHKCVKQKIKLTNQGGALPQHRWVQRIWLVSLVSRYSLMGQAAWNRMYLTACHDADRLCQLFTVGNVHMPLLPSSYLLASADAAHPPHVP